MDDLLPSTQLSPAWINFLIVLGAVVLAALLALVWFSFFHKNKQKRKRLHREKHRTLNPTLAQTGGLPPVRGKEPPQP